MKTKYNKNTLKDISNHLFYEFSMFMNIVEEMRSGKYPQGTVISNALIEAFAVHVRILLYFLYGNGEKRNLDDVLAEDFFSNEKDWLEIRPKMPSSLSSINKRVGKEVAHLTYSRLKVTPDTKPWPLGDIAEDMISVFDKFLENVVKDNMHIPWNQYYSIRNKYYL